MSMKPLMKYNISFDTSDGRQVKSWGVMPIGESKILQGLYNPEDKMLQIIYDSKIERYEDIAVQDPKTKKYSIEKRKIESYYKSTIPEENIEFFLKTYVENNFEIETSITPIKKIIENE